AMKLAQPFTTDKAALHRAIDAVPAQDLTPLYDPLLDSVRETSTVPPGRKVVIALTDGRDNGSKVTDSDVIDVALKDNIPLHFIGIGPGLDASYPRRAAR